MRGVTLVELLVVLTVVGLLIGLTGLALASLREPHESQRVMEMRAARAAAIRDGIRISADGALFLPDGRVIGPGTDSLRGVSRAR
jgi:prepilin-type N-terminal cleavage/methylation domain-containing protein